MRTAAMEALRRQTQIREKRRFIMSVSRIYVEKKPEFAVEARAVLSDLQTALRLNVTDVRIFNRYDADHLTEAAFERAIPTVLSSAIGAFGLFYKSCKNCASGHVARGKACAVRKFACKDSAATTAVPFSGRWLMTLPMA